jgi:hypothetical protein
MGVSQIVNHVEESILILIFNCIVQWARVAETAEEQPRGKAEVRRKLWNEICDLIPLTICFPLSTMVAPLKVLAIIVTRNKDTVAVISYNCVSSFSGKLGDRSIDGMKVESSDSSRYRRIHVTKQYKHECDGLGEPSLVNLGPLTGIGRNLGSDKLGKL